MTYKGIVADVDGTLIPPSAHPTTQASPRVVKTVQALQENGIVFTLATARSLDWVEGLISSLRLSSLLILDNGARIYDCTRKTFVKELFLSSEKAHEIFSRLREYHDEIFFVDGKRRLMLNPDISQPSAHVVKIMVLHVPPEKAERIYQAVKDMKDIQITKSVSGENPIVESIHITHADATKGKALAYVAHTLGMEPSHFVGIGDSYNDRELLEQCGLKVAMGNAVTDILAIADYIAPSYQDDGVANVIEKFFLHKSI